jgi:hypothetical protein
MGKEGVPGADGGEEVFRFFKAEKTGEGRIAVQNLLELPVRTEDGNKVLGAHVPAGKILAPAESFRRHEETPEPAREAGSELLDGNCPEGRNVHGIFQDHPAVADGSPLPLLEDALPVFRDDAIQKGVSLFKEGRPGGEKEPRRRGSEFGLR